MDRFITKRPRTPDERSNVKQRKTEALLLPSTIALTPPIAAIQTCESEALALFAQYPLERWYDLGSLTSRQILFGSRPGSHRTPHSETMPQILLDIYKHARVALLEHAPQFGTLPEIPGGCAINRYPTTANNKGTGIGLHKDRGQWIPLVVGVTLVESRVLEFANDQFKATHRHLLPTAAHTAYGFRDEMYTRWWHEVKKKGASQKQTIYSITYRFFDSPVSAAT